MCVVNKNDRHLAVISSKINFLKRLLNLIYLVSENFCNRYSVLSQTTLGIAHSYQNREINVVNLCLRHRVLPLTRCIKPINAE